MSKNKSLGSSPIGFQQGNSALSFIPDLGVKPKKKEKEERGDEPGDIANTFSRKMNYGEKMEKSRSESQSEKKVVSYYLEKNLVTEVKQVAEEQGIYYSALVSRAIKSWLSNFKTGPARSRKKPFF